MPHVTLIAGTYEPARCGVAHYTERLRCALHSVGMPSTVITTQTAAKAVQQPDVIGAVNDWSLLEMQALVRSLHTAQTDILHIQHAAGTYSFERAIFLLPLLLRLTGWHKPIVTTVHEYGWWEWQPAWIPSQLLEWLKVQGQRKGWWDREDGFLLTGSNAIITTNSQAETVIRQRLPAHGAAQKAVSHLYNIELAPNIEAISIDRAIARQSLRQMCNWPNDTTIIAFFGFLHPVKGLETLLTAFKSVIVARPNARLLLLGGVESLALVGEHAAQYWHTLHEQVAALGIDQVVQFTGYLSPELASKYLSGADIGVLPFNHGVTMKSGSLLALLTHGLPTVATASDPPDPKLTDASWLKLIPPRADDRLAIALTTLLDDPGLRHQMSDAGRKFVQTFEWNAIAKAHLHVYQSVLTDGLSLE